MVHRDQKIFKFRKGKISRLIVSSYSSYDFFSCLVAMEYDIKIWTFISLILSLYMKWYEVYKNTTIRSIVSLE